MTKRSWAIITLATAAVVGCAHDSSHPPQASARPVDHVSLDRYMGRWYEIARYPDPRQSACQRDVTADYTLLENHHVQVISRCTTAQGEVLQAEGVARVVDPIARSLLKVSYSSHWLTWNPWSWTDYWIVHLDPQYRYAAVATPDHAQLWLLSRTPQLPDSALEALRQALGRQGFDWQRLQWTPQSTAPRAANPKAQ